MPTILSKSIAILLGVVFFAGGVSIAVAADVRPGQQTAPVTSGGSTGSTQSVQQLQQTILSLNAAILTIQQAKVGATGAQVAVLNNQEQVLTNQLNQAQASLVQATSAADPNLKGLNCGIPIFPGSTAKITDCIPVTVYYVIYKPAMYLLMGAGYVFDKTIALSIDKRYVSDPAFINNSWKIIRDFSNMLFIFVLLYTGIMTMFGSKDWKRTVIQVVVIALLINFSLFFTKVVIDAGNILATGIYSSINTGTSFSASLAGKFQPQMFLDTAASAGPMNATIVFIIAAIVSVFAAWVFFKAALLFIGRLLAFWFLMIVSPFAFISTTFPEGKGNVFKKWFGQLTSQAFVAPVFLFLLYIIMQVITAGGGILSSMGSGMMTDPLNPSWFDTLLAPILIAILLVVALQKSLKFSEDMSGEFGQLGAKLGGAVMGIAGGAVLGGAAVAGRATIGRAAQRLEESGKLRQWAGSDSKFKQFAGRNLMGATDKVRQGTFDARGISTVQKAAGVAGVASIGKPWAGAKGGFEGEQKRQGEQDVKFAKRLEMTDDEKKAIEDKYDVTTKEKKHTEHEAQAKERSGDVEAAERKLAEAEKIGIEADIAVAKATVEKAKADLAEANTLKEGAKTTLEAAKAGAKNEIGKENTRRAGKFAEHVEGRNFIPSMGTYSRKQAQQTADKIRKGESKDEKTQKEWEKRMKKVMEEMTKGEEKSAEGGEKKAEGPAH